MGKGENAGNQHFLLFPQCFQEGSGVEINFFSYLLKIASAMISSLLNASCYSQNEKYDFLLYYCQYH